MDLPAKVAKAAVLVFSDASGLQYFVGVNRRRIVQHCVINRDQQLIVAAPKTARQRVITGLCHHAFANP